MYYYIFEIYFHYFLVGLYRVFNNGHIRKRKDWTIIVNELFQYRQEQTMKQTEIYSAQRLLKKSFKLSFIVISSFVTNSTPV